MHLSAPTVSQVRPLQSSPAFVEPAYIYSPDPSAVLGTPVTRVPLSSWNYSAIPPASVPHVTKGVCLFWMSCYFVLHLLPLKFVLLHYSDECRYVEIYANLGSFCLLDDTRLTGSGQAVPLNCCYSSSSESTNPHWPSSKGNNQSDLAKPIKG